MHITITARQVLHDRLGTLKRGRVVDLPDAMARRLLQRGHAELHDPRTATGNPSVAAGTPSSALPAAPASPRQTSSSSARGAKTRSPQSSGA